VAQVADVFAYEIVVLLLGEVVVVLAYSGEAFQGFRWKVTTAGVRGVISLAEMKW